MHLVRSKIARLITWLLASPITRCSSDEGVHNRMNKESTGVLAKGFDLS